MATMTKKKETLLGLPRSSIADRRAIEDICLNDKNDDEEKKKRDGCPTTELWIMDPVRKELLSDTSPFDIDRHGEKMTYEPIENYRRGMARQVADRVAHHVVLLETPFSDRITCFSAMNEVNPRRFSTTPSCDIFGRRDSLSIIDVNTPTTLGGKLTSATPTPHREYTMGQNQVILRHTKIHFPTSEGVSEVSERANE